MAANFESSMSHVQATMGITKDSMSTLDGQSVNTMDALSNLAKEMGASTAFSATECAEALNCFGVAFFYNFVSKYGQFYGRMIVGKLA